MFFLLLLPRGGVGGDEGGYSGCKSLLPDRIHLLPCFTDLKLIKELAKFSSPS
jgi:hypothetical protein